MSNAYKDWKLDLPERCRYEAKTTSEESQALLNEAADEIDELREKNERLLAEVEKLKKDLSNYV